MIEQPIPHSLFIGRHRYFMRKIAKIVGTQAGLEVDQQIQDDAIMDMFNGMCAVHLTHPAVTIHEIEPRSKRPKTWMDPENRIPLCEEAHRLVHEQGTRRSAALLTAARKKALEVL